MYRDSYGLIVTANADGGDTLRYENCFWLANHLRDKLQMKQEHSAITANDVIKLCEIKPGVVVRNPQPNVWWSNPKETSRDQTLGAFVLGQIYDKQFLQRLVDTHSKRWWFCSNGADNLWFTSVVHRARGGWRNILLYITDWFFFFDFLVAVGAFPVYDDRKKKWIWYNPDDTGKFWNGCIAMCQPGHETFIRRLARWVFGNFCRENLGTKEFNEKHPVAAGLLWESRKDTPDLGKMWVDLVYFYFPRRS